jgi:Cu/Ag efflux protein CusF
MMGLALGTALGLAASAALAENLEGTIEKIDRNAKTMVVEGEVFDVTEVMTAGATLDDLKEGDKVDVFYTEKKNEDDQHTAMEITKISQ